MFGMTPKFNTSEAKEYLLQLIMKKTALIPCQAADLRVSNLSRMGHTVNTVYAFSLLYNYENKVVNLQLVLKLYESTEQHRRTSQIEYYILNYLNNASFPVPNVYFMETNESVFGGPFLIMERIDGQSMKNYVKHHKEKEVFDVLNLLAATCVRLHELDFNVISENVLEKPEDEYSYARKSALIKDELNYGKNWDYGWLTNWLKINVEKCPCNQYSLLHFDMGFNNFIVTKNKKIMFIDWEWARVGDALMDVGSAYLEIRRVIDAKAASFFLKQYVNNSKREFDYFKLRFYIAVFGLNLTLYYRFLGTKELGTRKHLSKIFGVKSIPVLPIIRWYFTRRRKHLENYLRDEVLQFEKLIFENYEKTMFGTPGGKILSQMEKQEILKLANAVPSDLILDVGIRSGRIARDIVSKTGAKVVGIDVGRPQITSSKDKRTDSRNYTFIVADGQHIPFKKGSFDAIICIRTFKYFPNYVLGLSEMKRVLKQSGRLIFDLSSVLGYEIVLRHVTHSLGARGHHVFNIYKIKNLLNQHKLSVINSIPLQKIPHSIWTFSSNSTFLQFLTISENLLKTITPQFFSRSILLKCVNESQTIPQ